jgi:DNA-binding NarL/FixJ family response regulator
MKIRIGMADDHQLFLKTLSSYINTFNKFTVIVEGLNGDELLKKLAAMSEQPDIVLLDVKMPHMNDGVQAAKAIAAIYPSIKLVALSMEDNDTTIIQMLRAGCCAYLLKDIHPDELERALEEISTKGFYNADSVNIRYRRLIQGSKPDDLKLNDREITFLKLACSDLTYKQIASEMSLAERTIDGYREVLFEKLKVQSRVGMAMEAVRRQLVKI